MFKCKINKNRRTTKGLFNWGRVGSNSGIILPLRWTRILRLTQISKTDKDNFLKVREFIKDFIQPGFSGNRISLRQQVQFICLKCPRVCNLILLSFRKIIP